jgi:Trypsin-like peptidase domain
LKVPLQVGLIAALIGAQSALPRKDIPAIARAANGAIVSIIMSNKDGQAVAQGSGFLISKDGRVVTNYHVIESGSSAIVKLPDGAFFAVDGVLASDKARDVAIIQAHGENFKALILGNSDRVQVGEEVVAIGNPLSLESTVSNGIVSGIRTVEGKGGKFLQITTPISPGSSGGPLFNMVGEVVGITTLYLEGGENLNFAIPINDIKWLLLARFSRLQDLPNETEPAKPPGSDEAPSSPSGRGYYKQWCAAGGVGEVPPNPYVCFADPNKGLSDMFFVFKAYAVENNLQARTRESLRDPYVEFLDSDIASILVGPAAQEILRQGGWLMNVQTYSKGVRTNEVLYYWDKSIQRWETHDRFEVGPNITYTIQLVIDPKTLRYVRLMHATSTIRSDDTAILDMDSGACEAIPAKR